MSLSFESVVNSDTQKIIENEGMPLLKENDQSPVKHVYGKSGNQVERGSLIVDFCIEFPKYVSDEHKSALARILNK